MSKKIFKINDKFYLALLSKIIGAGTIAVCTITLIYVLFKLPLSEIKSAITYYYSETLVIEGHYEQMVNFTSESGNVLTLPASEIVANPLIMLSKQQFNWALIKGLFIGYVTFKIFCLGFLLWVYKKNRLTK